MAGWRMEDLEDVMGENGGGPPLRVQRSTVARHRARSSPVRGILHVTDLPSSRRKAPKPPWKNLTSAQKSKAKASAKRAGRKKDSGKAKRKART
jgi:hypothetical protein